MKLATGKINLSKLLLLIEKSKLDSIEISTEISFQSTTRVNPDVMIKELIKIPFLIYIKVGKLVHNTVVDNIELLLTEIVYVDRIERCAYIEHLLSKSELNEIEVNCIIIETKDYLLHTVESAYDIIFLEHNLLRKKKKVDIDHKELQSGRLDYQRLEEKAAKNFCLLEKDIRKIKGKYFIQNIFHLNLDCNK